MRTLSGLFTVSSALYSVSAASFIASSRDIFAALPACTTIISAPIAAAASTLC